MQLCSGLPENIENLYGIKQATIIWYKIRFTMLTNLSVTLQQCYEDITIATIRRQAQDIPRPNACKPGTGTSILKIWLVTWLCFFFRTLSEFFA